MASQKSTTAVAVEPKRQRGKDRVAAIMDAGAAVFAEKGYGAVTMTEIAAKAKTAIGSLYRFFPTKEALADALLARYGASLVGAFAEIEASAAELTPLALAGALIEVMQSHASERAVGIALVDALPEAAHRRVSLRTVVRERVAAILARAAPGLPADEALVEAALLLHVLKSLRTLPSEDAALDASLAPRARALIAGYLAGLGRLPAAI